MAYLVHTAHLQFAGLLLGFVSWILTAVSMGLVQWRVWHVADVTNVTSGVAWVGIWRACFPSRVLVSSELQVLYCRSIPFRDPSTPPEVSVAQVLVPMALIVGAGGNACAVYGLRRVYFGMERMKPLRAAFSVAGALCLLSGVCTMLPLAWNMRLPKAAPDGQHSRAESAPNQSSRSNHEWADMRSHGNNTQVATTNPGRGSQTEPLSSTPQGNGNVKNPGHARDNPAFEDT
ncbi:claudin-34-like isoform X2 [Brienomyrus brachyistius]|uniref:claudin-34-like isoform X2 n=1 Tax=Brienomyrus brachyistius TaxID=42636 RepID=UPI0020B1D823|nr:claudin-34-like isoform X2 [Brienomyrus brachyistius]